MACCRRMLGRMLARINVAATGDARYSTHPSPLGFEAGLIPRWSFFISNFPSGSWQASLASGASHPQRPEFGTASGGGLARDFAQVVSEPIFDTPRLVEP